MSGGLPHHLYVRFTDRLDRAGRGYSSGWDAILPGSIFAGGCGLPDSGLPSTGRDVVK